MEIPQQSVVYLVTYSRADLVKVPTRQAFADIVVDAFNQLDVARVSHWVVCQEEHEKGNDVDNPSNKHYHMAIKLTKRARWARVRHYLQSMHGVCVNFSDGANHNTYYSAYKYVTKEDEEFVLSDGHPHLNPPKTEKAIEEKKKKKKGNRKRIKGQHKKRSKRYSTFEVVEIIRKEKIKTRLELICFAVKQKDEGLTALVEFIANRGNKVIEEALALANELEEAPAKLDRLHKSRIDLLNAAYNSNECVNGCQGRWMECALGVIRQNDICLSSYCSAVYNALEHGRAKYRNVYIYGGANAGKTFMLSPLKVIYKCFTNPATGTFAWLGAEEAEVVVLNDFRYHPSIIAWGDLLQLLEGDTVHLPAPKNFRQQDIEFNKDTPFFATADAPLVLARGGFIDHINTQMMDVRWKFFHLSRQIPEEKQVALPACPRCFARFIIDYRHAE